MTSLSRDQNGEHSQFSLGKKHVQMKCSNRFFFSCLFRSSNLGTEHVISLKSRWQLVWLKDRNLFEKQHLNLINKIGIFDSSSVTLKRRIISLHLTVRKFHGNNSKLTCLLIIVAKNKQLNLFSNSPNLPYKLWFSSLNWQLHVK